MSRNMNAQRVADEDARRAVVEVLRATYQQEKRWVTDPETQFPPEDLQRSDISWFLVTVRGRPAGVLRVLYDPAARALCHLRLQGDRPLDQRG
jgi:hypothetical protein